MNVDLLIKENKELNEEKQRYKEMWFLANDSLFKYKDLEEQLGCPLEVIFKAIQNGIYTNWDWYYDEFDINAELSHIDNVYYGVNPFGKISIMFGYKKETIIDLKDYKKTWWLKKDKSE